MQRQINAMLDAGVIEPLSTDSNFNSPIFLVSKKSGAHRFVVDLRAINEQTMDDNYQLRNAIMF